MCPLLSHYLFYIELSIPIFYIPINPSISKSVITSSPSPILTGRLYTSYKPAVYVIFTALNLILDCLGLKLAMAIYSGLLTK